MPFRILVLGVGNTLLGDDGFGVAVVGALGPDALGDDGLSFIDGGTLGLALLPDIEAADAVIVVDAGELGAAPGALRVFEGDAVEAHLAGTRRNVHEVAVADLFCAARLAERLPRYRALVVAQPASTDWGLELSPALAAAVTPARERIDELIRRWRDESP